MTTKAQEWARGRNSVKWRLSGIIENMRKVKNSSVLTSAERDELINAIVSLQQVLSLWNKRNSESKKKYIAPATR